VRRAPDPVRGQVDRAPREHCSSVRPRRLGCDQVGEHLTPPQRQRLSQRCWIVPTNWAIPSFHLTLTTTPANKMQIAYSGPWIPDFPVPYNYYDPLLSCAGFKPKNNHSVNISEFCDPDIDNLAHRARALDTTDPAAGNLVWQQLDQKLTDASPAIFTTTWKADALVSRRLGTTHAHQSAT